MLREDAATLYSAPMPEAVALAPNEFDDDLLCPYCTAPTEHEDRRCRSCGGQLWIKSRKQEKRSTWLWFAMALQIINVIYTALPVILILALEGTFIARFLGLSEIPRVMLYLMALPSLFSASLAVGLYFRWRLVYYLLFADAVIGVAVAVVGFAFASPTSGIISFALAIARFMVVLQLGGDFEWQRSRILFRLDRGLKSAVEFMTRADFYNQQKMWGLALIHIRSALGLMPDRLDCRLALIVAYTRIKRYDLAVGALEQAKRVAPGDPRLARMEDLLNEMLPARVRAQEIGCASCGATFLPEEVTSLDGDTAQCPHCGSIIGEAATPAAA
jgi:tetratricopeptide (TPR) repeat protein